MDTDLKPLPYVPVLTRLCSKLNISPVLSADDVRDMCRRHGMSAARPMSDREIKAYKESLGYFNRLVASPKAPPQC